MILVSFMTFRILMNPCLFLSLNVLAACAALNVGSFEKLSGVDPLTSPSTAAFTTFVREEFGRWEKVVHQAGIQLQQ